MQPVQTSPLDGELHVQNQIQSFILGTQTLCVYFFLGRHLVVNTDRKMNVGQVVKYPFVNRNRVKALYTRILASGIHSVDSV